MSQPTVTKIINILFPYIKDEKNISKNSPKKAKKYGIILHKNIDKYLKYKIIPKKQDDDFVSFLEFLKNSNLNIYESEKIIKNKNYYGICDAIFKDKNDKYVLVDWKKSCISETGFTNNTFLNCVNSSLNKYSFQLHIYRFLLGFEIDKILIVNFKNGSYDEYKVELNEKWMEYISDFDKMKELMKNCKKYFNKLKKL